MAIYLGDAPGPPRSATPVRDWLARMAAAAGRRVCALHGHDAILQVEENRLFLRCTSCGHESPGWRVARSPSRSRPRGPQTIVAPNGSASWRPFVRAVWWSMN